MDELKTLGIHTVTDSEKAMLDLVQNKRFLDLERVPLICNDIASIKGSMDTMAKQMVTKTEFWPVKTLVYGFVGLMLFAIIGALISLVLKK